MKSIASAVPASDGERSPAPANKLSVIVVLPWSTWAMIPMLRTWFLLETILRLSAELLNRGSGVTYLLEEIARTPGFSIIRFPESVQWLIFFFFKQKTAYEI